MELPVKKYTNSIVEITLPGNIKIGGEKTFPLYSFEGALVNKPVIAMEVVDTYPAEWHKYFSKYLGGSSEYSPINYIEKILNEKNAQIVYLNINRIQEKKSEDIVLLVEQTLKKINNPIILKLSGTAELVEKLLSECVQKTGNKQIILAAANDVNYKTICALAQAFNHFIIAESPIDVNLAKQLNILITQQKFPVDKIIIDPLTGGLGYGLEYTYSVMERIRIAGLSGDAMLNLPFICFVSEEVYKVKEVKIIDEQNYGDLEQRGINWEVTTAISLILSGANIVALRHPESMRIVKKFIDEIWGRV